MALIVEAIVISFGMILVFFVAFLVVFVLALFLSPIERGLSQFIWSQTTPPPPRPATPTQGSFRDFSKKH
jgi:hypothetical protein